MVQFVNREDEMRLIDDAFHALQNQKEFLLQTPILDFFGVEGIGKTAILRQIEQRCKKQSQHYIWVDASKTPPTHHISHAIIEQVGNYAARTSYQLEREDLLQQSINATQALLEQGTAVLLLDAVDASNDEVVRWIEALLRDVIEDNKLFVVLTSKRGLLFNHERTVARKLTTWQLHPFNQTSCDMYLDSLTTKLSSEIRSYIFDWTRGYPLAMEVMAHAIIDRKLDPRKKTDRQTLLNIITQRVIEQGVLANIIPSERAEYQTALTLLSQPRRFNLVIMQDLIERFEPTLKRDSSIAYMGLPREISQATNVLSWNMLRAGYAIDTSVRSIFILKSKIEHPERHTEIHNFLARLNKKFADDFPGTTDHTRYLREFLYHRAQIESQQNMLQQLEQTVGQIINEPLEFFQQFYEEFRQDDELKEALGKQNTNAVLSLMHKRLAQENRELARNSTGSNHFHYLREFFYNIINDPEIVDMESVLKQHIREVLAEESAESKAQFVQELLREDSTREALDKNFELLATFAQEYILSEG
jgi:hypothetical protein